jgi:hypothetical protein
MKKQFAHKKDVFYLDSLSSPFKSLTLAALKKEQ